MVSWEWSFSEALSGSPTNQLAVTASPYDDSAQGPFTVSCLLLHKAGSPAE